MKSRISSILAIFMLIFFFNNSFALNTNTAENISSKLLPAGVSTVNCDYYATCIKIENRSFFPIRARVPEFFIDTILDSYETQVLLSDYTIYYPWVELYDYRGDLFYYNKVSNKEYLIITDEFLKKSKANLK